MTGIFKDYVAACLMYSAGRICKEESRASLPFAKSLQRSSAHTSKTFFSLSVLAPDLAMLLWLAPDFLPLNHAMHVKHSLKNLLLPPPKYRSRYTPTSFQDTFFSLASFSSSSSCPVCLPFSCRLPYSTVQSYM